MDQVYQVETGELIPRTTPLIGGATDILIHLTEYVCTTGEKLLSINPHWTTKALKLQTSWDSVVFICFSGPE